MKPHGHPVGATDIFATDHILGTLIRQNGLRKSHWLTEISGFPLRALRKSGFPFPSLFGRNCEGIYFYCFEVFPSCSVHGQSLSPKIRKTKGLTTNRFSSYVHVIATRSLLFVLAAHEIHEGESARAAKFRSGRVYSHEEISYEAVYVVIFYSWERGAKRPTCADKQEEGPHPELPISVVCVHVKGILATSHIFH